MYIIKQTSWANCSNFVNFYKLGQFPGADKIYQAGPAAIKDSGNIRLGHAFV
jgi:hypothetical protein